MEKATRVKYTVTTPGKYLSNQVFLGNDGTLLKSVVDVTGGVVSVLKVEAVGEPTVVETVACAGFTKGKTAAKVLLKKYGVNFFDECRKKRVKPTIV